MAKVEKSTNEAMEWMNNKLNLQSKQSLTVDPVVKTKEIEAKIKVAQGSLFSGPCCAWADVVVSGECALQPGSSVGPEQDRLSSLGCTVWL